MTTIHKVCPLCHGDVFPHCNPCRKWESSHTCDLVTCGRCGHSGSLDGRWWGRDGSHFRRIEKVADELRHDVEGES